MNHYMQEIKYNVCNSIPIIIVDDYERENEGDLMLAGQVADEHNIAFVMREAGGLMCVPCAGDILDRLEIPMMVQNPTDRLNTGFTVSVDAKDGTTTGMSVADRMKTIAVLTNPNSQPADLTRPGHLFPLRPRMGLLKERRGHTESSIELLKLFGLKQVAIITEMINDDGYMAKGEAVMNFAKKHKLLVISVEEIYDAVYNKGI